MRNSEICSFACRLQRALSTLLPILFVLFAASHAYAQYSVTASWDANTDAYTAGYRLYYGTASGSYQWSVDVGNQTAAPLNLSSGNYFLTVRAYNASYEYGPQSSEATVTVGAGGGSVGSGTEPTATINATLQSPTWAIVTWSTTNATSATINGNAVGPSGSAGMPVSGATTFTIVARNAAGQTATSSTTAAGTVNGAAPTAAIGASLDTPTTAFVTWTTTNATSATLNGNAVPVTYSVKIPISGTTTYTIVARNETGQIATASATVVVGGGAPPPAPTATISATMQSANSALVTWSTTSATSATINGNAVQVSGSTTVPVSATTTFTIVARNDAGATATSSATVTVSSGGTAPTATINASLQSPSWAIVTWSTTNATSITINGNAVGPSGTAGMAVSGATTFTIVARNAAGQTATSSATATGTGSGAAPTAAIGASLDSPTTAFVTWTTTNATRATINGSEVPLTSSVKVPIAATTTYTLVATNAAGQTATSSATVVVPTGSPGPTALIGASLDSPTTAFVTWTTTNATAAWLNGTQVPTTYSVKIPISGTTTYTIVARDGSGRTTSASATVYVP